MGQLSTRPLGRRVEEPFWKQMLLVKEKAQRILPPIRPRAKGRRSIARFEDATTGSTRSFCSRCGTPLLYARKRSPYRVNIPRALFTGLTGRELRYHVAIEELLDWAYTGKQLVPLQGYSDIVW